MESKIVSKIKSPKDFYNDALLKFNYEASDKMILSAIREAQKQAIEAFKEVAKERISLKQIDFLEATEDDKGKGVEVWSDNGSGVPEFLAIVDEDSITELVDSEELKVL